MAPGIEAAESRDRDRPVIDPADAGVCRACRYDRYNRNEPIAGRAKVLIPGRGPSS
jgi:hypothetical protein